MRGFLTHWVNDQVLDCFFGGRPVTPPPVLYIGLNLIRAQRGGAYCEPSAPSYARVEVPNDLVTFDAGDRGAKSNRIPIKFPSPEQHWGEVVGVFISDSPAGGNVLAACDLSSPREIRPGSGPPVIASGALFLAHL